ncbi:elongation factor P maturation arginine rhamnosyltransferase EarP [bacterium SGD-2]|nr:elongation factor P maturation arginine rhamnosyltransferase EarP [bacterium SGD-2]
MPRSFDIFCRVVDNYGDIGVCWRLARELARRGGPERVVRLCSDDLRTFSRIAPGVTPTAAAQTIHGIDIVPWAQAAIAEPADVVIEAFACSPPAGYLARLTPRQLWINLEYLSAEDWVESCHGLPSLQAGGLRKFFFFPGFTAGTGGLLREDDLIARRDAWQRNADARLSLLARLGVSTEWLQRLQDGARLVYVFCYPDSPQNALVQALAGAAPDTLILAPEGVWHAGSAPHEGTGSASKVGVHAHAFVDQETFDQMLWSADLNIVRGEDSLVRAIWAGRPMIWQPYRQADDLHLEKLAAWLARAPYAPDVKALMYAWSTGDSTTLATRLPQLLQGDAHARWAAQARNWSLTLAGQTSLAQRLERFCTEHAQTR